MTNPHTTFPNNNSINFVNYLLSKNLADRTVQDYSRYYMDFPLFNNKEELKKNMIEFLSGHHNFIHRGFIKNLFDFLEVYDIKIPKPTGRNVKRTTPIFTEDKIYELIFNAYQESDMYGCLIELMYVGALRRNETLGLKISNFLIDSWITNQDESCLLNLTHDITKGKKERYILIPPDTMKRILNYMKKIGNVYDFKTKVLFPTDEKQLERKLNKISKKTFGRKLNPHALRHMRSNHLKKNGMTIDEIQIILGHSSIATTQLYLHTAQDEVLEKLSKLYEKKKE